MTTIGPGEADHGTALPESLDGLSIDEFMSQDRFNRTVVYQSSITGKQVTASYAIAGTQDSDAPTFVYVGGIVGGRLHSLWVDWLCQVSKVRGIFVDRPGLGLFTPVRMEQRTAVWLEAVPLILKDANADKVGLAALSGGAPYAFNLLWQRPELIRTDVPIFLLSPWVHPSKSGVNLTYWMSWIPTSMARGAGRIATMALRRFLLQSAKRLKLVGNEGCVPSTCGASPEEVTQQRFVFGKKVFSEEMSGSTEDFLLGIKDPTLTWGVCADYEDFVARLAERCQTSGKRLCIRAWFPNDDPFVGKQGRTYFQDTFSSPSAQAGFDFESETVPDVSHENICYPENGVIGKMIELGIGPQSQ